MFPYILWYFLASYAVIVELDSVTFSVRPLENNKKNIAPNSIWLSYKGQIYYFFIKLRSLLLKFRTKIQLTPTRSVEISITEKLVDFSTLQK